MLLHIPPLLRFLILASPTKPNPLYRLALHQCTIHNQKAHHPTPQRLSSPLRQQRKLYSTAPPEPPEPKLYSVEEIKTLSSNPEKGRIIIDVREPHELSDTGFIPGALSMPLTSNPDAFNLSPSDFHDRFGFHKPRARDVAGEDEREGERAATIEREIENPHTAEMKRAGADTGLDSEASSSSSSKSGSSGGGEGVDEVIFYCKAGVRSRAAARMAREWGIPRIGDMKGGWLEWAREQRRE